MDPPGTTRFSERIREFLHQMHAYHFERDFEEIIRVVEKPGWPNETELGRMIETADALCTHMGAIRALTKKLIEDSRAIERRVYSVADLGSRDPQGGCDPRDDQA